MLRSLILSAEAPPLGEVCWFLIRTVMYVRYESLIYLYRKVVLSSERLISGICFLNIFLIFW
jgi:hypothetical protein